MKNAFSIAAKHSGKGVGMENKSLTIADTPSLHTSRTEHRFKRLGALGLAAAMVLGLTACGSKQETPDSPAADGADREKVVIYTPTEDYLIEYMQQRLDEQFPQYDISLEYYHSGDLAAKLKAEGADTSCDIIFDCEYGYLESLSDNLAVIDFIDPDQFVEDMRSPDNKYMPVDRYSGSVIVRPDLLEEKGLPIPQSYDDLLAGEYRGLIEMPDPTQSSTGYLFLKSLANAWGEEEALAYFDKLDENILQYTGGERRSGRGMCHRPEPDLQGRGPDQRGGRSGHPVLQRGRALYPCRIVHHRRSRDPAAGDRRCHVFLQ